ncbi:MAG TPA: cation diffusion facilitator family transporter [Candidatus Thermoplasmatota archaeon]|nr:cation diffusion facilitator family transporter [Candidatus Thermoplasmatota archaeon]
MGHSHAGHAHGHAHVHGHHADARGSNQRRLLFVMLFGVGILVAEVIAGFYANSLALLSDAAHMSTDVAALALAYAAMRIAARPPTSSKSYGYYRAETVAAFVNALALWVVTAYFVFEAWRRLRSPVEVDGPVVALVGGLSLAANLVMAAVLHRGHADSVNMRSAYIHVLSDALGSVAALVAGLGMMFFGATWLDPATTLLIAVLIVIWTWRLTSDSLHILLEGTPARVKYDDVKTTIEQVPGVLAVHDLHVWSLTTGMDNLSAHVMVGDAAQGPQIVADIRKRLIDEHHLSHVTIEVETADSPNCIRCD